MKHDKTQVTTENIHIIEKQSQEHVTVKSDRKTLHVLQPGAGLDKENLVSGGRPTGIQSSSKDGLKHHKETIIEEKNLINETIHKKVTVSARKKQKTLLHSVPKDKVKITVEDLTTQDTPSESYWCVLAEKRRLALEEALEENMTLHEKVALLEQEVETQKMMLSETTSVLEVLKEMVADVSDVSIASEMSEVVNNTSTEGINFTEEDEDFNSEGADITSEGVDITSNSAFFTSEELHE